MPRYKVKHQGQIQEIDFDGVSPTKAELRSALALKPKLDYPNAELPQPPSPKRYEPKDWLDRLDPHARDLERPDRNMFTVDLSKSTNRAVDRIAQSSDDEAERKWKAQKLGFISGMSEGTLNMLGAPENVLMGAPRLFRQSMADYPGHSINPRTSAELVPVGGEDVYNTSFPRPQTTEPAPINYFEKYENAKARQSPMEHLAYDETGAIGKNIRKGHISGRFIKKNTPYEPDSFDIESSKPYEEPQLDYVKQMLDSLKLADKNKKLKGLGGRHLLKDETGAVGDIKGLKAAKEYTIKKSNDFDYDGTWHLEFPDGRKFPIYRDVSSGMNQWEVDGLPSGMGVTGFSKKELIDKLKDITDDHPYLDTRSGRREGTVGERLSKYREKRLAGLSSEKK